MNLINLYTGPYHDAVYQQVNITAWHHDNALKGDIEAAYALVEKRHNKLYPFDDSEIWALYNGGAVYVDPNDIWHGFGWLLVDDAGNASLSDAAKVYLHFEILNNDNPNQRA